MASEWKGKTDSDLGVRMIVMGPECRLPVERVLRVHQALGSILSMKKDSRDEGGEEGGRKRGGKGILETGFGRKVEPLSCEDAGSQPKADAIGMGELLRGLTGKEAGHREVRRVRERVKRGTWIVGNGGTHL